MQNRNYILDEIAGLLIIYMIVYHIMQWAGLQNSEGMQIMSYLNFFMPWFFYKGGVFFKKNDMQSMLSKSFNRLLMPYILWSMVGVAVFGFISCYIYHTHTIFEYIKMNIYQLATEGCVPGNLPLWFLLALFAVRIIINECMIRNIHVIVPTLAGICISAFLHFFNISLPHYINNISSGVFFFGMAILLKNASQENSIKIVSIILFVLLSIISKPIVDIRDNTLLDGYYMLWPLWSIVGIITINTLFEYIHKIIKSPISPLFFIGKHSLAFYVIHWPIIMVIFRLIIEHT